METKRCHHFILIFGIAAVLSIIALNATPLHNPPLSWHSYRLESRKKQAPSTKRPLYWLWYWSNVATTTNDSPAAHISKHAQTLEHAATAENTLTQLTSGSADVLNQTTVEQQPVNDALHLATSAAPIIQPGASTDNYNTDSQQTPASETITSASGNYGVSFSGVHSISPDLVPQTSTLATSSPGIGFTNLQILNHESLPTVAQATTTNAPPQSSTLFPGVESSPNGGHSFINSSRNASTPQMDNSTDSTSTASTSPYSLHALDTEAIPNLTHFEYVTSTYSSRTTQSAATTTTETRRYLAPTNPCGDTDRLCEEMRCRVEYDFVGQCSLCICADPEDVIRWQSVSSRSTLTSSATSPYLVVHGIHYVTLDNPCLAVYATCPVDCVRVSSASHNACTECDCTGVPLIG